MAKYIYSTMSADNDIILYKKNGEGKQVPDGKVTIAGKANVANNKTLITPQGVVTTLEDKEYDLIKDNNHFKKWIEAGFITVETKQAEVEKVAKNMTKKDKSAQKKKEDLDVKAEIVEE
jgi:hypothetical protein